MSLYGVKLGERLIAVHHDSDIVWEFIFQQQDSNLNFVKFKKNRVKTLEENGELHDLYLINLSGKYVPRCVVGLLENKEYKYGIDVILSVIENEDLDKDEIKILKKAVKIIRKISDELDTEDINISEALRTSAELKDYDNLYKEKTFTE